MIQQIQQLTNLRNTIMRASKTDALTLWELFVDSDMHDGLKFRHPEYAGQGLWRWYILNVHEVEEPDFAQMFHSGLTYLIKELEELLDQEQQREEGI